MNRGLAKNGLQHLQFQWMIEFKVDGKIILQDMKGLNANDQSFKREEFIFTADWQNHLQPPAQQEADVFLSGDADEDGESTHSDINDLGTESAAYRRVEVADGLHLNLARNLEPLIFATV